MIKISTFLFAAAALVACAGSDSITPTTGNEVTGLTPACGGIAAIPCPKGYACVTTSKVPDARGRCKKQKTCVQTMMCTLTSHWDSTVCACVPNECVDKVMCMLGSHWDGTLCECVEDVTCSELECSKGYHCEMKGLNGGSTAVCIKN